MTKRIQLISALFNYGEARGYIDRNPFSNLLSARDRQPKVKREPFSKDEITSIFSLPLFRGCAADNWRTPGNLLLCNSRFWVPIIAVATGCRIEEIAQLRVEDIGHKDAIYFFDINDNIANAGSNKIESKKALKTKASRRHIPIHSALIEIGLLDYLSWLRDHGHALLFPELEAYSKKSKELSRWFNRDVLPLANITSPQKVFHSFRHLFKDRCRDARIPREISDRLTGHSDTSASAGYGSGWTIEVLNEYVQQLTFPGLPNIPRRQEQYSLISQRGVVCTLKNETAAG